MNEEINLLQKNVASAPSIYPIQFYPYETNKINSIVSDGVEVKLINISECKKKLEQEISEREKLKKKYSTLNQVLFATECIFMTAELAAAGVTAVYPGLNLIVLPGICFGLTLTSAVFRSLTKKFNKKAEKHFAIEVTARTKLNSILDKYVSAIEDGTISLDEYKHIMTEWDKYQDLKLQIINDYKKNVVTIREEISKEMKNALIEKGKNQIIKDIEKHLKK